MADASGPTVSIVMPTYNRADLLPRSIDSILCQDFADFELLIVDDGSTDDTAEVVEGLQTRDPRLRYLKLPENRGPAAARNEGLDNASGKYIGLADSDDLWLPCKLKAQVEVLAKHPEIEILFCDFWNIDDREGTKARAFQETRAGLNQLVVRRVDDELHLVQSGIEIGILIKNFIQLGTVLFRAEPFEQLGNFDATLCGAEDWEFCWRAAVLGAQYAYLDRIFVERHINASSITANAVRSWTERLKALEACHHTYRAAGRHDLFSHVRAAEHRTWRNLIWAYGRNRQRAGVTRAYWKSLRYGLSARTFFFFVPALLGPRAIMLAKRLLVSTGSLRGRI